MADISVENKTGSDLTWLWAVGAIIAVLALMAWLFSTRDLTTQVVTTDAAADSAAEAASSAEAVDLATLGAAPDQYSGRVLSVENVPVAVALGNRSFWAEVTGANPLLVVVGPEAPDVSWIQAGESANLEGTVEPVTEEAISRWIGDGQTMQPDAAEQASFATHYLNATNAESVETAEQAEP